MTKWEAEETDEADEVEEEEGVGEMRAIEAGGNWLGVWLVDDEADDGGDGIMRWWCWLLDASTMPLLGCAMLARHDLQ